MQYKNISAKSLTVESAVGRVKVDPGETVSTAPKFAQRFVEAGELSPVATVVEKKRQAKPLPPKED